MFTPPPPIAGASRIVADMRQKGNHKLTPVQPLETLLATTHQAAAILGVSPRTIRNLMARGELRSVKLGGARRFHRDELKRLAESGAAKAE